MTDLIDQIYDALPGYTDTCQRIERLKAQHSLLVMQSTSSRVGSLDLIALDELLASLDDPEPSSLDELTAATTAAISRHQAAEAIGSALPQARTYLQQRRTEILATHADKILRGLNDAMTDLANRATALAPLAEISTPEASFASKRADEGAYLHTLLERYEVIRREQLRILRDQAPDSLTSKRSITAYISNVEDVFDLWGPWIQHGHLEKRSGDERRPINPPWPAPHTAGFALWALQSGAALWVPTIAQQQAAAEHLGEKAREKRTGDPLRDGDFIDPSRIKHTPRRAYMS